jgi:hypothetical protein
MMPARLGEWEHDEPLEKVRSLIGDGLSPAMNSGHGHHENAHARTKNVTSGYLRTNAAMAEIMEERSLCCATPEQPWCLRNSMSAECFV